MLRKKREPKHAVRTFIRKNSKIFIAALQMFMQGHILIYLHMAYVLHSILVVKHTHIYYVKYVFISYSSHRVSLLS